jgi:hypothetical protein
MPKTSNNGSPNPLQCPNCGEYRYLVIHDETFRAPVNREITLHVPFFECKVCKGSDSIQSRDEIESDARVLLANNVQDNQSRTISSGFENKKFKGFDNLGFKYDPQDYYYIPGLYRRWDDGYLTPVFFKIDLLLHYNNHSE